MNNSIYQINKSINKSIEFHGLKAQYIWYFAGGILCLMICFAILYIIGVNTFICLGLIAAGFLFLMNRISYWSKHYGEYGMMKMLAWKKMPKAVKSYSRKCFHFFNSTQNAD
jgi:hypothetical protein